MAGEELHHSHGYGVSGQLQKRWYSRTPNHKYDVVAIDCGVKLNIIRKLERKGCNVLIVDTAGRLQIDEELMEELVRLKGAIKPHEILLVVDALTGQDAVNAAEGFNDRLGIDGIIMTKMDGDSRGGAALSAKKVTGRPVKFVGTGEKFDALEPFHPERMAKPDPGHGRYAHPHRKKAQED